MGPSCMFDFKLLHDSPVVYLYIVYFIEKWINLILYWLFAIFKIDIE